jgi:membrane associated rhomboid family serine protease
MIPIRDENPTRSAPVVTIALIALNVVLFLTEPITGSDLEQARYFVCRAAIPYEVTHGERIGDALARGVELASPRDVFLARLQLASCPEKNVWFSILLSMFLHGGLLHIGGNMLYLWVFGNNVEDRLGRGRYIGFYLLAGIAATYAQSYVFPDSATPLVGASGAIAGVLGAYLLMFPAARVLCLVPIFLFLTTVELPAIVVLGLWFVLQFFQGVGSVAADTGVAYMAHVGGFLAGMLLLLVFRPRTPPRRAYEYEPYA